MKSKVIPIANYFIQLAKNEETNTLSNLKLLKLVYITSGYVLAILKTSILDSRFDKVEAWKFGPVIPSLYYSCRCYGSGPITKQIEIEEYDENGNVTKTKKPIITDESESNSQIRAIADFVWNRYNKFSAINLVSLTHRKNTPWSISYKKSCNVEIPETLTQAYYELLLESININ